MSQYEMPTQTLYSWLADNVAANGDRVLFHEPHGDELVAVTARDFFDEVQRTSATLHELGVEDGDCIATWLPNWSSTIAWQFAASAVGAHVIGVNTRYNVTEVRHILTKARPKVLAVAHDFQRLDLLGRARKALAELDSGLGPVVVPIAGPGKSLPDDVSDQDLGAGVALVPNPGSSFTVPQPVGPSESRLSTAFTTSGSTGLPKLAAHRESAVLWHAGALGGRLGFRESDCVIGVLPYSGVFGFNPYMSAIVSGASILLHPVFTPARLIEDMAEARTTHFFGADDILSAIRSAWEENPVDLSSWRRIGIADFEGKSEHIAEWAAEHFGTATGGVYGSSELFALTSIRLPEWAEGSNVDGGGPVVSPLIGVRLADPETNELVPPGSSGELQFRGPNVVDAYLGDEGEGAKAFTPDGWFHSGDLGSIDEDGAFNYLCRIGDVLRLKGFLVEPAEIETRLAEHPSVHTAKVVGSADSSGAPTAVAFVTLRDSTHATDGELVQFCKDRLARFKVPAEIRIIDEMPTTVGTNGTKIKAATLREWAKQPAHANLLGVNK